MSHTASACSVAWPGEPPSAMRLAATLTSVRFLRAQPATISAAPRASLVGSSWPRQRSTIGALGPARGAASSS
eukprot:12418784-Alexandrium_andersonii.AAC.1